MLCILSFTAPYSVCPIISRLEELASDDLSRPQCLAHLSAPIFGALTERLARKRVIVVSILGVSIPTLLAATSLAYLIFWRFLGHHGPRIVVVTYIGEEWPPRAHHELLRQPAPSAALLVEFRRASSPTTSAGAQASSLSAFHRLLVPWRRGSPDGRRAAMRRLHHPFQIRSRRLLSIAWT